MEPEAWVTLAVLVVLVVVLVRELVSPVGAIVGALVTLVLTRVATPEMALRGFSSTATFVVAGLFVVAAALQRHAGIGRLIHARLANATGDVAVLTRLCVPAALASSVIANTPLVAALAPVVRSWADRTGRPPSRVLMPLSFATILGGTATTIGTSTTLVASGIVAESTGRPFALLEVTPIGLPLALLGTIALVLLAPRLLPDRGAALGPGDRAYAFRMVVEEDGPLDGIELEEAGLRHLDEQFVAAIERGAAGSAPARPDSLLAGGDVLVIVGDADHVRDLPTAGLRHADEAQVQALAGEPGGLHEVVVGRSSPLVNRTLKQLSFRGRFDAAVLAIGRAGDPVQGKLGTVPLQAGDVLLVRAGDDFATRWRDSAEFAVVVPLEEESAAVSPRRWLTLGVALAMVLAAAFGLLTLIEAVLWACLVLVVTRTISFRQAFASLDVDVLVIIAAAIGIGTTVESSGLAAEIAQVAASVAGPSTPLVALVLLLVATTLLTEVVTNVASVTLMIPIALSTAAALDVDPRGWAVAVALVASSSFLTPIGYQTNTIVYGLGGYRFGDYWRLGLPLVIITVVVTTVTVPLVWG